MNDTPRDPAAPPSHPLCFWRWKLHWQILLGLMAGALIGLLSGAIAVGASEAIGASGGKAQSAVSIVKTRWDYLLFSLIGDLFLNGLKLIVIPLVVSSIILAVAGIGAQVGFGRMGLKTLAYYMITSLIAILIGLALVNLVKPGLVAPDPQTGARRTLLSSDTVARFDKEAAEIRKKVGDRQGADFLNVFREMVPDNPVKAMVQGNLLGLIVCSLLIGFFLSRLTGNPQVVMRDFIHAVNDITMNITDLVLCLAPLGVAMLVAATVSENYAALAQDDRFGDFVAGIVKFTFTALAALCIHFALVFPLILWFVAGVNPWRHYKAMAPALMTAFSTASSNATLPVSMECAQKAGVSKKVSSFVLPLGATVNMDGTALYECVAAIFICQAFGIELSFAQQFFVVIVALFTSIGVAGVPSASLVAIVVILHSLSQQLAAQGIDINLEAGLPILLVFDRFLDMCRTSVNIFSDSVGAVVVARSEGETGALATGA
jgi:Na+/H+-dicarboxylate symporter